MWRVTIKTRYSTGDETVECKLYRWRWSAELSRIFSRLTEVDGLFDVYTSVERA